MLASQAAAVFERFTERARQAVVLAQEEARTLKHNWIGTEHILLGLLREREGLAAVVLESFKIAVEPVRAQVVGIVGSVEEVSSGQVPFTPRAKKVLELALKESQKLGHSYIGTEHILLGLLREREGIAARVLLDLGAPADKLRERVIEVLDNPNILDSYERPKLLARAAMVDVHLQASSRFREVAAIVADAADPQAANRALQSAFGISEKNAESILNSDLRRFTRSEVEKAKAMRADIQRALEATDPTEDA